MLAEQCAAHVALWQCLSPCSCDSVCLLLHCCFCCCTAASAAVLLLQQQQHQHFFPVLLVLQLIQHRCARELTGSVLPAPPAFPPACSSRTARWCSTSSRRSNWVSS